MAVLASGTEHVGIDSIVWFTQHICQEWTKSFSHEPVLSGACFSSVVWHNPRKDDWDDKMCYCAAFSLAATASK